MHDCVIETHGLRKVFKGQNALNGLELRVPRGSIFGFLGRNGAGKTTTIKLLMGLLRGDGGDAFRAARSERTRRRGTLSLPVSRTRLLMARAALGLVETAGVITALGVALWLLLPTLRMQTTVDP